ncbi:hypothetical protein UPYG_G00104390 [Umbra pygmaea]|uniref:Ig-like domain-containing protein n=1 Tax=Umbra pygmaea TaxID=75934 RepID=A0ABD0X1P3_UMBPY
MVTVSTASPTAPTVFPLAQCGGSGDMVTLGCIATGFTPPAITFNWKDKTGTALTDFIEYPPVQSNSKYIGVSQLQVKSKDWEKGSFQCSVKHSSTSKEVTVDIVKPAPPLPVYPSLYVMTPSNEEIKDNQTASFACLAKDFSPKDHTITWLKNDNPINEGVTSFCQDVNKYKDKTLYSATSFLKVNDTEWTDVNAKYTCQFKHSTGMQTKTVQYSGGVSTCDVRFTFKFIEPTPENIFLEDQIPIECVVTADQLGFNKIMWITEDGTKTIYEDTGDHLKKSKYISALLKITAEEWKSGASFKCVVEHNEVLGTEEKIYKRENGEENKRPSVFLLAPSDETSSNTVTLTCYVKDFYPKDLLVVWLVDDEKVTKDKYKYNTTSAIETGRTYYSLYSQLTISMDDWNQDGVVYSCVVYHESIPKSTKMLVRTLDKNSNKPNLVNLSLNVPGCKA